MKPTTVYVSTAELEWLVAFHEGKLEAEPRKEEGMPALLRPEVVEKYKTRRQTRKHLRKQQFKFCRDCGTGFNREWRNYVRCSDCRKTARERRKSDPSSKAKER